MPRKPKPLYPIYSLVIASHHMSGRPSYVTLKCEKHAITMLRYMFGSVYYVQLSKSMIRQRFGLFCIYCINCLHVHMLNLCCSKNCQLGFLTRADTNCSVQLQKEASVVQWLCHLPCKAGVAGLILGFSSLSVGTINRGHVSI